jgi:signal transduction histidine kinase
MERKASDSKRRFVSYSAYTFCRADPTNIPVFHEVRVPLNTALLAVQNLEGENVFKHIQADQNEMVHGLMRSLTTMEKVLNDVLSFNRMEAGKFAQARKPFDFHKSINLVAMSHRPQANAAGIGFHVELDPDIDKIGGVFVGDEMRLRQITSNLVSNSVKFTEEGSVRIVTKLIYPRLDVIPDATTTTDVTDEVDSHLKEAAENQAKQQQHHIHQSQNSYSSDGVKRFSADSGRLIMSMPMSTDPEKGSIHLESLRHSSDPKMLQSVPMVPEKREGDRTKQKAIVRVEIHDTGIGLKKDDLDE